jgi:ELWxxDGT repeat protein
LWTTDGTTAGTYEIPANGAYPTGLYPYDLTVFNGEVLFGGFDNIPVGASAGHIGMLWAYNGQTASEISGITGEYSGGLNLSDLTVFNHEVLFNGTDAAGKQGLCVTDGTAADTHEIAVNGAAKGGVNPSDLTVISSREMLFNGVDAAGNHGLWVTDGTTAGTYEFAVSAANSNGLSPADLSSISKSDVHAQSLALLLQHAASGFAAASYGHDGTPVTNQTLNEQEHALAPPHASDWLLHV